MGSESDLGKLKCLIDEKELFKKIKKNKDIQKLVLKDIELKDFLQFALHVESYDEYNNLASVRKNIEDFLEGCKEETADFIDLNSANLGDALKKIINRNSYVEEYDDQLKSIKIRLKSNEKLGNSLEELVRTREGLIKKSKEIKDFPESPSVCVFAVMIGK